MTKNHDQGGKDNGDNEDLSLSITDDLHEIEQMPEETGEADEAIPVVAIETEPTSRASKIEVKDVSRQSFKDKLAAFLKTKRGKVTAILIGLAVLLGILFAVPATRYAIAGVFVKKDVSLTVIDQDSKKPVSSATVTLGGTFIGQTDSKGKVKIQSVPVGNYRIKVDKKYYLSGSSDYIVPILSAPQDTQPQIKATGRNVTVTVTNRISSKPVSGATISISGSSAVSNDKGEAQIILPVKNDAQKGTVKANGYNEGSFEVQVKNVDDQKVSANVTPSGKLFFLSKRTGKIDVMKSDLDGSNAEVVVAGTGQESDASTVLLSTTDWKYLALLAAHNSEKPKLYLIDTASGKQMVMDEGDADFQLIGWSGHQFAYQLTRNTKNYWDDKRQAVKSFNAETAKLTTLDETQGSGNTSYDYASEGLANFYLIGDKVLYTKTWDVGQFTPKDDKKSAIMSAAVGGTKTRLKEFAYTETAYFDARLYEANEVYFRAVSRADSKASYYEYEDGKLTATADTNDQKFFNSFYATYLISPSGKKTLWYEPRDGKNVIFVGDASGNNGREVGVSDYIPYGWYSDDYLLFSKNGSELYILAQDASINDKSKPLKVTDYHKPQLNYPGYGGGYGGQ